ncbi:MAG: GDCCVxC domain-containing (seleno)protein [Lamprobacter sp.]|uniref:GDCCVxC domain-containing (seleno)protein n=1 Tax=Lamprobacter sp. TaxID=3100796 RepID=UPI002B261B8F|nr:GDCCVxC domain-containing (seleno)protein [Lamprobacter sp.]MEA3641797.1 GDCCVxC domain-containing (seleno)protein [Lamprobacter sp.]
MMSLTLDSTIRCPECGFSRRERMPTDACVWFWECPDCGVLLKPKPGDCCVYCSYADIPCPPIQAGDGDCCQSTI